MTDAQFRSWLKIRLEAAVARPHYMNDKRARFTPSELVWDIEKIALEARHRVSGMKV